MARQAGDIKLIGTIEDLCFYRMEGAYYVRRKSSLTGKRFWKGRAFEGSRSSATRFAEGNRLASRLYRTVPSGKRTYALFCFLKKRSIQLLKEGKTVLEAESLLMDYLANFGLLPKASRQVIVVKKSSRKASHQNVLLSVFGTLTTVVALDMQMASFRPEKADDG